MILGEDSPVLVMTAQEAFVLRDAMRRWLAEHQRYGARQKITAVRPLLEQWERVAAIHAAGLITASANGHRSSAGIPADETLQGRGIGTAEAGRQLGVTARQVRRLIEQGELDAITVGRAKLVDRESVEQLKRMRGMR